MKHPFIRSACLLVLLCLSACNGSSNTERAADMQLHDLAGKPVRLTCAPGRMLVLNFWASWCKPCMQEIPHFIELQDEFRSLGFDIEGILLDSSGSEYLKSRIAALKIPYQVYIGDPVAVAARTGVSTVPATMIIDSNGTIIKTLLGYHSKDELRAAIQETARSWKTASSAP